ncbi:hypothetical protein HF295_06170 [Hujiaoplasma nucleasis]|uniref:Uncharacterized protein n=1 Tax=Hujiaoplasma nucleasis TaxID=2725268 RepID=A0A7L6N634_9MOLU|nr:hypothetical protein [Hujiaoplasma nucleasis]QLY40455.1 hypothetical protein HF295_06170 [Hujiaoplasma nucleasis]
MIDITDILGVAMKLSKYGHIERVTKDSYIPYTIYYVCENKSKTGR